MRGVRFGRRTRRFSKFRAGNQKGRPMANLPWARSAAVLELRIRRPGNGKQEVVLKG